MKKLLKVMIWYLIKIIPFTRPIYETRNTQTPVTFSLWFMQKIIGFNRKVYWPVHFSSIVTNYKNIYAGIETCPGYMPGCYIQGNEKIYLGDYTQISANVGIISANHDFYDNRKHKSTRIVKIGKYCWIGMNSVILPGVELGDFTIVAAGSIVTKSFPEGYCVIGGNPAKVLKTIPQSQCIEHKSKHEYYGYIPKNDFDKYKNKYLNVT
jgi:acetyltransferase-like isoleucine patch superfamily enzyme